jgi:hypothetical protein
MYGIGAASALRAIGPQEKALYKGESKWTPRVRRHTPMSLNQRTVPLVGVNGYLGQVVQVDIPPKENADLLANLYLQCAIPAGTYTEMVGRAIIQKVELLINGLVVESINDDWYTIHDQLFLDADEKVGLYQVLSNGTPEGSDVTSASQINLIVPLDFFFCHRYTHKKTRDKPYFPLCAIGFQTLSVRFTFNTQAWITSSLTPIDLINPRLLIETIWLSDQERTWYRTTPLTYNIQKVQKEAQQPFKNGVARINLTASFPVSMMVWFIRDKRYEKNDPNYYSSRYQYGYTTKYIKAAQPLTFFNGVVRNYIDTIDFATIFLDNRNILSRFPGALYYTFKQSFDHGFTTPNKSMYMYCFSEKPQEYSQSGSVNFADLRSTNSFIDIQFLKQYASQVESEFSLNLYYYGYSKLYITNGTCQML